MARLDRLGDDGKRTVQMASVIGRQFLVRPLARARRIEPSPRRAAARVDQALELIYEQGS